MSKLSELCREIMQELQEWHSVREYLAARPGHKPLRMDTLPKAFETLNCAAHELDRLERHQTTLDLMTLRREAHEALAENKRLEEDVEQLKGDYNRAMTKLLRLEDERNKLRAALQEKTGPLENTHFSGENRWCANPGWWGSSPWEYILCGECWPCRTRTLLEAGDE